MAEGPFIRFDLLSFIGSAVHGLYLAGAPTRPDQVGGFIASQPSITGRALLGKRDLHNATVQPFRRMVGDGCPEILQISAGTPFVASVLFVLTAPCPGYLRHTSLFPKTLLAAQSIEILLS